MESAVGAHLVNTAMGNAIEVLYWRERGHEVDFVVRVGPTITALEVKSGRLRDSLPGMTAFAKAFNPRHYYVVGGQGIAVEEFLRTPASTWMSE